LLLLLLLLAKGCFLGRGLRAMLLLLLPLLLLLQYSDRCCIGPG
jgi:hypothetical protein